MDLKSAFAPAVSCRAFFRLFLVRKMSKAPSLTGRRVSNSHRHYLNLGHQSKEPYSHSTIRDELPPMIEEPAFMDPGSQNDHAHHEGHPVTVLSDTVAAREFVTPMDPLEAFLQTRPFQGSLPRRVGFWTFNDRRQQQVLRVDPQLTAQAPPQRQVERTHHQIETALHARSTRSACISARHRANC